MSDKLYPGPKGFPLADLYARVLEPVVQGRTLWIPRLVERGGGAIGDIGFFDRGVFARQYNVYEVLPHGIPLLQKPTLFRNDEPFEMPGIEYPGDPSTMEAFMSSGTVSHPGVYTLTSSQNVVGQRRAFAFMDPLRNARINEISSTHADELREWLTHHRRHFPRDAVIVTGVICSQTRETGLLVIDQKVSFGFGSGLVVFETSRREQLMLAATPQDERSDINRPDFALVLRYKTPLTRSERLVRNIRFWDQPSTPMPHEREHEEHRGAQSADMGSSSLF